MHHVKKCHENSLKNTKNIIYWSGFSSLRFRPCRWLWRDARCRRGIGRVGCTAARTQSEAACAGWCWATWRSQRWTWGEGGGRTGCGCKRTSGKGRCSHRFSSAAHLQIRMKSWRTLGLKASRSLNMTTTGGSCSGSSVTVEGRFFPGVSLLDFFKKKNLQYSPPMHVQCVCTFVAISSLLF